MPFASILIKNPIILPLIVISILIFGFIFTTNSDIEYKISLNDRDVPQGTPIYLTYDIKNALFSGDVYNIEFYYKIGQDGQENRKDIQDLSSGESNRGAVKIETHSTQTGEHTIYTRLDYWRDGKMFSKYLTVKFIVY